jgi:hypothetical protein
MKKISLLLAGVLFSSFAIAGGPDEPKAKSGIAVVRKNATLYKLFYKSELATDVKIEIINDRNEVIFKETIVHTDGFIRPYNFADLGEGQYTIKVDNGSNWLTERVSYRSEKLDNLTHLVALEGNKYLLTVPGQGSDNLTVRIFDQQGKPVYDDTSIVEGNFAKVYNLGKMQGPFSFEVSGKGGVLNINK